jgi:hypothetical protein
MEKNSALFLKYVISFVPSVYGRSLTLTLSDLIISLKFSRLQESPLTAPAFKYTSQGRPSA